MEQSDWSEYYNHGTNDLLTSYRPLAVGVAVGVVKPTATILEYNGWAFSVGHKYREHVCSSFAMNQNEWSARK